eukprot:CAMPEP_0172709968 /NCGR_PEP_ID=MMETSP1074-20121228/55379_1 /TAXON_ID=2916 /ORGANISM="Ceratium fusus, Strain PA161109" /LENGTH=54 /DNA_ID=CAMNT_0013533295 /DNA_START=37 /DNA_END=197 /DNA_ORIENTATION=+
MQALSTAFLATGTPPVTPAARSPTWRHVALQGIQGETASSKPAVLLGAAALAGA